jgi:hypothetical protein
MYHNWKIIAAAAISSALPCTNAQGMPNLGNVLANQTDLSTFYGLIQVFDFGYSSCSTNLKILGSRTNLGRQLTYD